MKNFTKFTPRLFELSCKYIQFNEDFIKNYNEDRDEEYSLEVDFQYSVKLDDHHNELPFLSEIMKIEKVEKLAQ